jgi:orotidine-5'-phosphate decarboxylase
LAVDSLVCVGLDPDLRRFPAHLSALPPREAIIRFNAAIIEATAGVAGSYKPNLAFYVAYGIAGLEALAETRRLIPPEIPVILDCKVGDMDNTASAYARGYFDELGFDAVTVNPYLGEDSLVPFLSYPDRGVIILCKTSNPGSGDLQDLEFGGENGPEPLYATVARRAAQWSRRYPASVGLVVGATYPDQVARARELFPDAVILLPGVGAQGGDVAASVAAGVDTGGFGLLVSSTRGIIYAGAGDDFADRARDAAERLRDEINAHRGSRVAAPV